MRIELRTELTQAVVYFVLSLWSLMCERAGQYLKGFIRKSRAVLPGLSPIYRLHNCISLVSSELVKLSL